MGPRLILLPLELGVRAARLGLRAARLPLEVIGGLTGGAEREPSPADSPGAGPAPAPSGPAPIRSSENGAGEGTRAPGTTPGAAARAQAATPPRPAPPEHVSEEPTVVAEVAEAGAEEGAHAEVEIAEPWEGYAGMTARDIEQRIANATSEEVAVVRLYEAAHKARQSVLRSADRRMGVQDAERRRP